MKRLAFTLSELSVVLAIIAILVVIITQGALVIKGARLTNARNLTIQSPVPIIDGLLAWYEISHKSSFMKKEQTKNAEVTSWYDISPSSIEEQKNTLTAGNSNKITYIENGINKIPSLRFSDNAIISLNKFDQGDPSRITLFMVFRPEEAPGSNETILSDAHVNGSKFTFGIKNNAVRLHVKSTSETETSNNPANFENNKNYITAIYFNDDKSAAYVNNASMIAGGEYINPQSKNLNGITIGANKNGDKDFNGLISEVIIYDRPLKSSERIDVMNYLSQKYKIAVSGI